jgi:hypothetical protein
VNEPPPTPTALVAFAAGCGIAALILIAAAAFFFLSQNRRSPDTVAGITATPTRILLKRTAEPDFLTVTPAPMAVTVQPTSNDVIPTVTPIPPTPFTPSAPQPTATTVPLNETRVPLTGNMRTRVGNGPDALARYMPAGNFVLDGALFEWGGDAIPLTFAHFGAEAWQGPDDLSGMGQLGWNEQYLYLAVTVRDEAHVQTQRGWEMYRGDSVELWLDTDLQGDFDMAVGNGDDWQFGFSPGDFARLAPEGVVYIPVRNAALNQQISVAAQPNATGYTLEAMIPWSVLQIQPGHGTVLGYTIDLSDNDVPGTAQQQTQVTHNPHFQFQIPTTFGNLVLE